MKKKAFWIWLALTVVWIGVIFWHSSRVAADSDAESLGLLYYVQKILPWMTNRLLRKCGHFAEFALLGFLLTGVFHQFKSFNLFRPIACALFIALCDETIQHFIPGRCDRVKDVWIDLGGAVFGTLLLCLYYRLRSGRKKQKS